LRDIRAAEVDCPSTPKTDPQTSDWKAETPSGTLIAVIPSMLRSGIATNPEVQRVVEEPPAPAEVDVVMMKPKGSGEVVEDCFH